MLGRLSVIGLYSRKLKKKQHKSYLYNYLDQINEKEEEVLTFSDNPVAVWIFGSFIILVGLFLFWHILFKDDTLFSSFHEGTWWQYLITFGILALGISFLFFGIRTEIEINKPKDIISIKETNLFGQNKIKRRRASDCISIHIAKIGSDQVSNYTINYELILEFEDNTPFRILATTHRSQAKKQYLQIAKYLDLDFNVADIEIKDQTLRAKQKEAREAKAKEKKKE